MIEIDGKIGKLIKMHSGRDLTLYVKEHPSLRNPIFYFNNFIKNYQYSTVDLKKSLIVRELYSNFYEILNLLIEFIEKDFSFRMGNGKMNSLAFN